MEEFLTMVNYQNKCYNFVGFLSTNSLHQNIFGSAKQDPFKSFEVFDLSKNYFHQLNVWTNSCRLRFMPEFISCIILIVIFNLYTYLLISNNQVMVDFSKVDSFTQFLLYLYAGWVVVLNLGTIFNLVFTSLSGRKSSIAWYQISNILMIVTTVLLFFDVENLFGKKSDGVSDAIYLIRVVIIILNNFLVWTMLISILLNFEEIGPLISLLYMMIQLLLKYLLIYAVSIICFSAIFTSIFFESSSYYSSFSRSIIELFGSFVNTFNTGGFYNYKYFGQILVMLYVTISAIMLINLLIALLTSAYDKLILEVQSSYISILISNYKKFKWNKEYGFLIFVCTPFNFFNAIFGTFLCCINNPLKRESFSNTICKIYFLFYFGVMLLFDFIYSLVLIPLCYIKGIYVSLSFNSSLEIKFVWKLLYFLKWLFLGLFFVIFCYYRDVYYKWKTVFEDIVVLESKTLYRISNFINKQEIVFFLNFIHSLSISKLEIHILFLEYLLFEDQFMTDHAARNNAKTNYLKILRNQTSNLAKIKDKETNNFLIQSVKYMEEEGNELKKNTEKRMSYIKKNLIIIEIMENFIIDDGNDIYVDIEKLKMLLPQSCNIDKNYIKKIIYTNIKLINKAINKMKKEKKVVNQYYLLNQNLNAALDLDKDIDREILKAYNNKVVEGNKAEIVDYKEKKQASENHYEKLLNIMNSIKNNIKGVLDEKSKDLESKIKS